MIKHFKKAFKNFIKMKEDKKIHYCTYDDCNAAFARPHKLEFHIRKHEGEKSFVCDHEGCSKSYTTPSHLKRHKICAHEKNNKKNEILCNNCGLSFSNKYSFKKHFFRKHNDSKIPFKCAECSKQFKKKKQLASHMAIHSGEMPYRCEICNLGFDKLHLFNKHKRNHKTFTCDCEQTFNRWTEFCKHRRTECKIKVIDHKCIICNKTFTTKSNLRQHTLVHVDESKVEVFHCPQKNCNRSYKYNKNLEYHIKVFHKRSIEKLQLNCTEPGCETILSSYINLKRHLIHIHKKKLKTKESSSRKTRHDQGTQKKAMAAILSGLKLKAEQHKAILGKNKTSATVVSDDNNEHINIKHSLPLETEVPEVTQKNNNEIVPPVTEDSQMSLSSEEMLNASKLSTRKRLHDERNLKRVLTKLKLNTEQHTKVSENNIEETRHEQPTKSLNISATLAIPHDDENGQTNMENVTLLKSHCVEERADVTHRVYLLDDQNFEMPLCPEDELITSASVIIVNDCSEIMDLSNPVQSNQNEPTSTISHDLKLNSEQHTDDGNLGNRTTSETEFTEGLQETSNEFLLVTGIVENSEVILHPEDALNTSNVTILNDCTATILDLSKPVQEIIFSGNGDPHSSKDIPVHSDLLIVENAQGVVGDRFEGRITPNSIVQIISPEDNCDLLLDKSIKIIPSL